MSGAIPGKRLLVMLACVLVALSCRLPFVWAAQERPGDELVVGVPTDRCPVFYLDPETHEIAGIGIDLMRVAAEDAGYTVRFEAIGEQTLKDALDNPAYDLIMPFGSAISSASGSPSVVSDNFVQTPFTLVTEGSNYLPPLNELRVGMLSSLGGAAETVRTLYPGMEITLYETMPACVQALREHEVDALLHNSYVWSYVLQKPSYASLRVQPTSMFSMDFRAGTLDTPRGRGIIERLNGGIASISDTRRQAITLDHTTRRLYEYDLSDYLYQYGLVVLLSLLLIVALVVIALFRVRALRAEQEERMRQLIDRDPLTGVLSLNGFRRRVTELLREHPDIPYLFVYVNIKNFKFINDSLGREAGDELLRFWTQKTEETLTDEEAMGRLGADHFIVLRRAGGDEGVRWDDREVIDLVRRYFIDRGGENQVQVCGGVYVLAAEDYREMNVDRMLDYARMAERKVRSTRKDGYEFYNPEEWERGKTAAEVVSILPEAIQAGDIRVWYQPQVNYETNEIIGAEALCRWAHAEFGWISPAVFIPILEEAGLIFDLDQFVWETVCQDLRRWNEQGYHRSASVNVSRSDFAGKRDIPGHFERLVETYGLAHEQLRIEITETAYAEDPSLLIETTRALRELGFSVEMDDFGSGYSSLHMLKEVPVDRIKLDLHFLSGAGDLEKGHVIVSHMIQMVCDLGMEIIAEGVETDAQASFLKDRGCVEMQGYRFYKPMPVEDFECLRFGQRVDSAVEG